MRHQLKTTRCPPLLLVTRLGSAHDGSGDHDHLDRAHWINKMVSSLFRFCTMPVVITTGLFFLTSTISTALSSLIPLPWISHMSSVTTGVDTTGSGCLAAA